MRFRIPLFVLLFLPGLGCPHTASPADSDVPAPECPEDTGPTVPDGAVMCLPTAEVCDGFDNDCDGSIDEDLTTFLYLQDCDGDGIAGMVDIDFVLEATDGPFAIVSCLTSEDLPAPFHDGCVWRRSYGDCDDTDGTVYPGQFELCDDRDNNCNGQSDEGC